MAKNPFKNENDCIKNPISAILKSVFFSVCWRSRFATRWHSQLLFKWRIRSTTIGRRTKDQTIGFPSTNAFICTNHRLQSCNLLPHFELSSYYKLHFWDIFGWQISIYRVWHDWHDITMAIISIFSNTITPSKIDLCTNSEKSYARKSKRSPPNRQPSVPAFEQYSFRNMQISTKIHELNTFVEQWIKKKLRKQ